MSTAPDPGTLASRIGPDAVAALRRGATVYARVALAWVIGVPAMFGIFLAIPPIAMYVLFGFMAWFAAGVVGLVLSLRYMARQQRIAVRSAARFLGLPRGPFMPTAVMRHGIEFVDAWLVGHGITNPATGLVPPRPTVPTSASVPPFRDRPGATRTGIVVMFGGLAIVLVAGGVGIWAAVVESPMIGPAVFVAFLGLVVVFVGVVITIVSSVRRARARIAWAQRATAARAGEGGQP